jgi:hypothetical protein
MQKKKPVELWIQIVVLMLVVSAGLWYSNNGRTESTVRPESAQPVSGDELPVVHVPEWRDARPDELTEYVSKDMQFAIGLPKSVIADGERDVPLVVYENQRDATVDIVTARDYLAFDDKIVDITADNAARAGNGVHIQFATAQTEDELLAAIQKKFGPRCRIFSKIKDDIGMFSVRITDEGVDSADCAAAGPYRIRYSPTLGRVALWMVGNGGGYTMHGADGYLAMVNSAMAESFYFLNKENVVRYIPHLYTDAIVWKAAFESDGWMRQQSISELHECALAGKNVDECALRVMSMSSASLEAVNFYRRTGWFASAVHPFGNVTLIDVVNPWRANSNDDYVIVNALGEQITLEGGSAGSIWWTDEIAEGIQKALPGFSVYTNDEVFIGKKGNRLVFEFDIKDEGGCHACSSGYAARIGFNFVKDGRFTGASLLNICASDSDANTKKLPMCTAL